jgi:outer membrane receptor protein involved in Fe transport
MKKLAITFSAAALLIAATSFAADSNETTISAKAKTSFEKDFVTAENATWSKKDDVYIVTFDVDKKQNEAAYNEQGQLVGTSRVISKNELPLAVSLAVADKFQNYDIAKIATEITYENQTNYYLNVANGKQLLKLKCAVDGNITVESRFKK